MILQVETKKATFDSIIDKKNEITLFTNVKALMFESRF